MGNKQTRLNKSETPLKAVVFDMDGLMFNTEDIYSEVLDILLQRREKNITPEGKLAMTGLTVHQAFQKMIDLYNLADTPEILIQESDELVQHMQHKIKKMPGLDQLLAYLENYSIPKAIATSTRRHVAQRNLKRFNLQSMFAFVLSGEDVTNCKPAPDIYLLAAEKLNIRPQEMLVLEDSLKGSQAGVAAQAFTVAVPSNPSQDYSHADLIVKNLESPELLRYVHDIQKPC